MTFSKIGKMPKARQFGFQHVWISDVQDLKIWLKTSKNRTFGLVPFVRSALTKTSEIRTKMFSFQTVSENRTVWEWYTFQCAEIQMRSDFGALLYRKFNAIHNSCCSCCSCCGTCCCWLWMWRWWLLSLWRTKSRSLLLSAAFALSQNLAFSVAAKVWDRFSSVWDRFRSAFVRLSSSWASRRSFLSLMKFRSAQIDASKEFCGGAFCRIFRAKTNVKNFYKFELRARGHLKLGNS